MAATVILTVLNRKNYDNWCSRIKTYLLAKDLWDVLDQERPKTEDEESKTWKKKNAKALYTIQNSCEDDTYRLIKGANTAKQAWDILSKDLKQVESLDENLSDENDKMTIGEAYPTQTDHDTVPKVSTENGGTGGHDESDESDESNESDESDESDDFVKYVESNDWENAINLLRQNKKAASRTFPNEDDGTALHYAINNNFKNRSVPIIKQLVKFMAKKDLKKRDRTSSTALDLLIRHYPEMVELAKCMVERSPKLVTPLSGLPPVVRAQRKTKGEKMACFLYFCISPETLKVSHAAYLISLGLRLQRFDIAWDLIQRYPKLAMTKDIEGHIPLVTLAASNRSAFKSGSRLNLWGKIIYNYGKCIRPLPLIPLPLIKKDIRINVEKPENDQSDQRHLISSGMSLLLGLVANFQTLLGINRIYHMKLVHERFNQLLRHMCTNSTKISQEPVKVDKLIEALFVAAERGHVEYILYINQLLKDSKVSIFNKENGKRQNLLQVAAECRHHKVYSLIYVLDDLRKKTNESVGMMEMVGKKDSFGNNMLHTVASITPLSQIHHIQGAALQMQRELQWFKEVESIANPVNCESLNNDNKTPREVFTENHKEMLKAAEKSMKETSTSCTVVGALIITIMFAAAFTIPGGHDEKIGLPKLVTTFIISDAISLFSSTTSVIMFLGILTSRYSEDDFYKSLPRKMIIGLFTLFLSITTMMIVFSCGLYIMLDGKLSIVIPSILLAIVPVASFIWMQFPLLVEFFNSTFNMKYLVEKLRNCFQFLCILSRVWIYNFLRNL